MSEDIIARENEEEPIAIHTKTPGAILLDARRDRKLSQADVAKQLRLSVQWIKDIENDNYAKAPALIYARGYLRAYAKLVGVLPDDVIAAFETLAMDEEFTRAKSLQERPVRHQGVVVISRSTRLNRNFIRWVTAVALILLVVLVGVWWQGQKKHAEATQVVMQPREEVPIEASVNKMPAAPPATADTNVSSPTTAVVKGSRR